MRWIGALVVMFAMVASEAPPAQAETRAAKLKNAGMSAAKKKDWELARKNFGDSYALDPLPLTLFNLASAQRNTDRLVEARASFLRFLAETKDRGEANIPKFRSLAKDALLKLQVEIPTVRVRVTGVAPPYVVVVDGRAIDGQQLKRPIAIDPGEHTVLVRRGQAEIDRKSVAAGKGDRIETDLVGKPLPMAVLTLPAPSATTPLVPPSPRARRARRSFLSSDWFWGITGAVVGAVVIGGSYNYYQTHPEAATRGTLGGPIELP